MNLKLRGFAKDAVLYGLGDFGGKIAALIVVPIVSRILTPADYGVLDLLTVSTAFISAIIVMNLPNGFQKYYYLTEGEQRKILVTSTIVFELTVTSCSAAILMLLSKPISSIAFASMKYHRLIFLYSATLPLTTLLDMLLLLLRLDRRPIVYSAYSIANASLLPIATYLFVVKFNLQMEGVVGAMLATLATLSFALLLHHRRKFTPRVKFSLALELARFSIPGVPGIIARNIQNMLPRYFLGFYGGLAAVGIYAMADKVAKIIEMLNTAFNLAWNPFAFSNAGKDDEKYLYAKVFKYYGYGLVMVSLLFGVFSRQVLWILTPPQYHGAEVFVAGLCLFYGARSIVLIFGTGLYISNKVLHTSYLSGVLLLTSAVLAFLLVPRWGTSGMVVALGLSGIIYLLAYAAVTRKHFPFELSAYRLITSLVLAMVLWVVSRILGTTSVMSARAIGINLAILVSFAVIGFVIILSPSEKRMIFASTAGIWRRILKRNIQSGKDRE